LLDEKAIARIAVGRGVHVLRCLPETGAAAAIRFSVR